MSERRQLVLESRKTFKKILISRFFYELKIKIPVLFRSTLDVSNPFRLLTVNLLGYVVLPLRCGGSRGCLFANFNFPDFFTNLRLEYLFRPLEFFMQLS